MCVGIRAAIIPTVVAAAMLCPAPAAAQQNLEAVQIRTEQVTPNISVLFGAGGNIAVGHGSDGTVIIDDQFAPLTDRIVAAIAAIGASPARFLINTHWHFDHTGGNENFGRAGAVIMAHDHVRDRMATRQITRFGTMEPSPAVALPVVTWHDGITVHLNGERIRTMHMPHAHTDGDSVVWFQDANVFHMGDLYFHQVSLPFIDLGSGGNVRGVLAAANRVIELANEASVIIPGHGPLARKSDLIAYRDMLQSVINTVERERAAGKTLDQIIAMRPAAQWDTSPNAFINGDAFVTAVYNSLAQPAHDHGEHGGDEGHGHRH